VRNILVVIRSKIKTIGSIYEIIRFNCLLYVNIEKEKGVYINVKLTRIRIIQVSYFYLICDYYYSN
jgi:hypothetical protein